MRANSILHQKQLQVRLTTVALTHLFTMPPLIRYSRRVDTSAAPISVMNSQSRKRPRTPSSTTSNPPSNTNTTPHSAQPPSDGETNQVQPAKKRILKQFPIPDRSSSVPRSPSNTAHFTSRPQSAGQTRSEHNGAMESFTNDVNAIRRQSEADSNRPQTPAETPTRTTVWQVYGLNSVDVHETPSPPTPPRYLNDLAPSGPRINHKQTF